MALGRIDEQGNARVEGDIAAVLRKVGEDQQRAGVEIVGDEDERGVGGAL
jgi:hypothetical protein